ncbi:MAG TPA: hypothetical protein VKA68_05130 [bacterium]|nr:hypothetical protein [bacterium]
MKRIHKLAAEIFRYSYDNYLNHLGINERFDRLMPKDVRILTTAMQEEWSVKEVAEALDISENDAITLLENTRGAIEVVDAENPAECFRNAVRQCIQYAVKDGLDSQEKIEQLARQICYRAADLGVLLEERRHTLHQYSRHLRRDPDVEYYEGYFKEPFQDASKNE